MLDQGMLGYCLQSTVVRICNSVFSVSTYLSLSVYLAVARYISVCLYDNQKIDLFLGDLPYLVMVFTLGVEDYLNEALP